MPTVSKAALMRDKKTQGLSTGEIARLFGVSYHYAYQVVVVHAGRGAQRGRPATVAELDAESAKELSIDDLFALTESKPPKGVRETRTQVSNRVIARDEVDRRADAEGIDWMRKWLPAWEKRQARKR